MNVIRILGQLGHEQGYCVIVVTHDPETAELADMVCRVKDGILMPMEQEGKPA